MRQRIKLRKPFVFEWDDGNQVKNALKHKVENNETEEVFLNNPVVMPDRTHYVKEERYFAFGITDKKRQLIISFTLRGENQERIRPIMARDQNKKEKVYHENEILKREVKKKSKI
jgi:uncharacterized DUF497 family protein